MNYNYDEEELEEEQTVDPNDLDIIEDNNWVAPQKYIKAYAQLFSIYRDKSYNNGTFQPLVIPKTPLLIFSGR